MRAAEIADRLAGQAADVCAHLFPAGRRNGDEFEVGDLTGAAGRSLRINLNGKAGVWSDFATGEKGDLLDLWRAARGLSTAAAMSEAADWLGAAAQPHRGCEKDAAAALVPSDAPAGHPRWKGNPSGRWCYGIAFSADSRLTAGSPRQTAEGVILDGPGSVVVADNRTKLRALGDRIAVAFTGRWSPQADEVIDQTTAALAAHPPPPRKAAQALIDALRPYPQDGSMGFFLLAGYGGTVPCVLGGRAGAAAPQEPWPRDSKGRLQPNCTAIGVSHVAEKLMRDAPIPWAALTLQDVVDYGRFLVYATATQLRFELNPSVGVFIETVTITPTEGLSWLAKRELVASEPGPVQVTL